ncbi:hypothetical protein N0K08_00030 [Acidovorax sp. Be4]|uniref:Lipoprotein n=1 Tax=Acidovorax bellezanensis TaxID=2976702 RepID=A0ABT2PGX1_9BURK|nr:hypothetical protein [Acidovorax sp. Be4]MCT9809014.1 hypothetical protein [Acidovorax sp. Be4]
MPASHTPFHVIRQGFLYGLIAIALHGCGGGGDSDSNAGAGNGGGSGTVDIAALAGTYSLKAGSTTLGALMLDKTATVVSCKLQTDSACTAQVTPQTTVGGVTTFKLQGDAGGSAATGSITAQGGITGQLTAAGGAVQQFTGTKVSGTFADCVAPFTRSNGQCELPSTGVIIAPRFMWSIVIVPSGGEKRTLMYCLVADCTAISPEIFLSPEDLADAETPAIIAYANSVATEFQAMLKRLYDAKTYPSRALTIKILSDAVAKAINTETPNAVETARAAFVAAGFPAAAGGTSTGPSGTATTAESVCASQPYPGDTSEPQVFLFDKIAQLDACLYRATSNSAYLQDGNNQCKVLNGLLQATVGTFHPLFCNGPLLKQ